MEVRSPLGDQRGIVAIAVIAVGLAFSIAAYAIGMIAIEYGRYSYGVKVTNEIIGQRAGEDLRVTVHNHDLVASNVGSAPSVVVGVLIRRLDSRLDSSRVDPVGISPLENGRIPLPRPLLGGERAGALTVYGNVFWGG